MRLHKEKMTSWWNKNAEQSLNTFKSWVGDYNDPVKVFCRKYVIDKGYKQLIDCGCGVATEYFGYKNDNYEIDYTGLDSCNFFVEKNRNLGIKMIHSELESVLPINNSSFEVVFCRGVLEHLSYYELALQEFIRIGKSEVMVVFFIKPSGEDDKIDYWEEQDLYHNTYNKNKIEEKLLNNKKVDSFYWEDINEKENILHIILKKG